MLLGFSTSTSDLYGPLYRPLYPPQGLSFSSEWSSDQHLLSSNWWPMPNGAASLSRQIQGTGKVDHWPRGITCKGPWTTVSWWYPRWVLVKLLIGKSHSNLLQPRSPCMLAIDYWHFWRYSHGQCKQLWCCFFAKVFQGIDIGIETTGETPKKHITQSKRITRWLRSINCSILVHISVHISSTRRSIQPVFFTNDFTILYLSNWGASLLPYLMAKEDRSKVYFMPAASIHELGSLIGEYDIYRMYHGGSVSKNHPAFWSVCCDYLK